MHVAEILREKGTKVNRISQNASLAEGAARMIKERIGSLVVCDFKGEPVSVVGERDIVRALGTQGIQWVNCTIGDIVSSDFVTCTPETPTRKLLQTMTAKKIRHVPVMENGQLCGIVSIGDVVKHHLENTRLEVGALRDRAGLPDISEVHSYRSRYKRSNQGMAARRGEGDRVIKST